MGTLQFVKVTSSTTIDVRVPMDRLIAEAPPDGNNTAKCHLLSVIGGDADIGAITAAFADGVRFGVSGPGLGKPPFVCLGENPTVFRSSIAVPGRNRPVRHLVALSAELAATRPGGDPQARKTVLYDADPAFLLYRLAMRFGLPALPEWSDWFAQEIERRRAIQPLIGLGCRPVIVAGTKKRFLGWIGHAIKRGKIRVPEESYRPEWNVPSAFLLPAESSSQ